MRAPLLLPVVGVLLLAGCTTSAPVHEVSPTPLPATPVPAPGRLPGELMRTVLTATSNDLVIDDVPRGTGDLVLHALCTGPASSTMTFRLLDRDAQPVGFAGTVDCTGQEALFGDRVAGPARITQIELTPSSLTGTEGWAVLSTSAGAAG